MIRSHTLRKRDLYLNKLIAFQDTEPIKVVTGIRRCGKSSLLKLMAAHLRGNGVSDEQIIEMNFESYEFLKMTADELYRYVKERVLPDRRIYLFFDELQRMDGWENAVNSFHVDFDCDIYITGSNAYLLSSEYSTYLSGRCVEIKMLPLSFAEFVDFYGFTIKTVKSVLGGQKKKAVDQDGTQYELREIFDAYMRFGGMPGIADVGMEQDKALTLLEGIYSTVIVRDILEREKRRGQRQLTDAVLLKKIVLFLADNIGSSVSISSIGNTLVNEGLLDDGKRKVHTRFRPMSMRCWSPIFSMKSNDLTSKAGSSCAHWVNIISWTSACGITCLDSATATADMRLKMLYISNCCAAAMMSQSARSATRKLILLQPKLMKKYTCR